MTLKEWSTDCLGDHRNGLHEGNPCVDCYPCHLSGIRFNMHRLKFWNNSKDSANEIAAETQKLAKKEGREILPDKRWT